MLLKLRNIHLTYINDIFIKWCWHNNCTCLQTSFTKSSSDVLICTLLYISIFFYISYLNMNLWSFISSSFTIIKKVSFCTISTIINFSHQLFFLVCPEHFFPGCSYSVFSLHVHKELWEKFLVWLLCLL